MTIIASLRDNVDVSSLLAILQRSGVHVVVVDGRDRTPTQADVPQRVFISLTKCDSSPVDDFLPLKPYFYESRRDRHERLMYSRSGWDVPEPRAPRPCAARVAGLDLRRFLPRRLE